MFENDTQAEGTSAHFMLVCIVHITLQDTGVLVSPGRGVTGVSQSHPRQSTHLSPIYQQLVGRGHRGHPGKGWETPSQNIYPDPDDVPNPGSSVHILTA